jgi:hypothetical protein
VATGALAVAGEAVGSPSVGTAVAGAAGAGSAWAAGDRGAVSSRRGAGRAMGLAGAAGDTAGAARVGVGDGAGLGAAVGEAGGAGVGTAAALARDSGTSGATGPWRSAWDVEGAGVGSRNEPTPPGEATAGAVSASALATARIEARITGFAGWAPALNRHLIGPAPRAPCAPAPIAASART